MLNKLVVAGLTTAAVVVTSAGIALASPDSPTQSPASASSAAAASQTSGVPAKDADKGADKGKGRGEIKIRRALHAEWVTRGKDGTFVTHTAIKGAVVSVSAASISVKAQDGVSKTFVITKDTKVRLKDGASGTATMGQVKAGLTVVVAGTGTSPLTAAWILIKP